MEIMYLIDSINVAHRLNKLRVIRIIAHKPCRADVKPAFVELGILTLPALYILNCLIYLKRN